MINCRKSVYLDMLRSAELRGTPYERARLRDPGTTLFPKNHDGNQVALCTWLMIARADMRGKHALTRVSLEEQHRLMQEMMTSNPVFFSGCYEEETTPVGLEPTTFGAITADVPAI